MIEFTKSYKTSTGEVFATITEAQQCEIGITLKLSADDYVVAAIIANADKIVDILTTTPTSKPRARKANGGRKPRKPATPAEATTPPVTE
jgi:hypothetical protein